MKRKKHGLKYQIRQCVFNLYWIQIASLLTFYMIYFLLSSLFKHDGFLMQLALSLLTELSICFIAYKKVWLVGDYHAGEVMIGTSPLKKYLGFVIGGLTVAPIIVFALLSSLIRAVGLELGIFETLLNLFVFRWSGVVEYINIWTNGSSVVGVLVYIFACVPLIALSCFAFRNGFFGVHEGISLRKKHCPPEENIGAREAWEKA